ncbi:MAG TPA: sigma-54 dependent transcriptional regulator, partial [Planctomycetota bacterium]|nr:sigma-54 dependent transcriptional regulator [Planctomycetota bacterium]
MTGLRALVVDDERNIRTTLAVCLESLGCAVSSAESTGAAEAAMGRGCFDVVFVDLQLGRENGLDLLPKLLALNPSVQAVVITAFATIDTAVEAIRRGAADYLPKPFTPAQIEHIVARLAREQILRKRVLELEARLGEALPEITFETRSPKMRAAIETATKVAQSDATVLLRGESGTGKGVLARIIHEMSPRKSGPFVAVNSPSLSEDLIASELFGHVQGAFTGAHRDRQGRIESAEGGTLFLDEIGDISPNVQAKLLRFLQERAFERVGDSRVLEADVRVLVATNRDLQAAVREGRFREDLLFRLNVIEITLPSLRERPEDILPLARLFLSFSARQARRPAPVLSKAAEEWLLTYRWPGNLRELRNAIERAVILWPAQVLEPEAFPQRIAGLPATGPHVGGPCTVEQV